MELDDSSLDAAADGMQFQFYASESAADSFSLQMPLADAEGAFCDANMSFSSCAFDGLQSDALLGDTAVADEQQQLSVPVPVPALASEPARPAQTHSPSTAAQPRIERAVDDSKQKKRSCAPCFRLKTRCDGARYGCDREP